MNEIIRKILISIFGRQLCYRIGRYLYLLSRAESINNIDANGEKLVQKSIALYAKVMLKRELIAFDIGANIGEWTLSLLKQMKSVYCDKYKVFLFEPVPLTISTLQKNLDNEKSVFIAEMGVSSSSGIAEFYTTGINAGTNSIYDDKSLGGKNLVRAKITTADDFCAENKISHIDILKSDTEGHDFEVILGARNLLAREMISVLQFEYSWRWIYAGHSLKEVLDLIQTIPYSFTKLQRNELLIFTKWHPEIDKFFEGNYALIHNDILRFFPIKKACFDDHNALKIEH